jgi:DNA repair photolyase
MESPEPRLAGVEYVEVQCKSALNPVNGMGFGWSLNPYTGCEHRCAFCYVRARAALTSQLKGPCKAAGH